MSATATQRKLQSTANGQSSSSVVIFEDLDRAGRRLKEELAKWKVPAVICKTMSELQRVVPTLRSCMFAIDIDMGASRRREGFEAIRYLKGASVAGSSFYIAALTSHVEYKFEASKAGVDAFVVKTSTETDALELITRLSAHIIEREKESAYVPQSLLAEREYGEIRRQLSAVKRNPKRRLATPLDTIQRALNWPFLFPNEQLILSALFEQVSSAQETGKFDKKIASLCLEGVAMLLDARAQNSPVEDWLLRAKKTSASFTLNWMDEEIFDEA
jgi:DNA-binding NarL/FixJ family response regulator